MVQTTQDLEPLAREGMVTNPVKNTELVVQVSLLVTRRKVCRGRKTPLGGELFVCRRKSEGLIMQRWREYRAKKKLIKIVGKDKALPMIDELKEGYKQAEKLRDDLRKLESPEYDKMIGTLNHIVDGTAPVEQKKLISIKLVEQSTLTDYEKQDLLGELERLYDAP